MPTLLEALYTYAQKNRTAYTLEDGAQIKESGDMSDRARKELLSMLPEKGRETLLNYISEEELIQGLELEAAFRAGLSIGLELSPL